jgi:hypothetical protein
MMLAERWIIRYLGTFFLLVIAGVIARVLIDPSNPLHPANWLGSAIFATFFLAAMSVFDWNKPWRVAVAIAFLFAWFYLLHDTQWGLWATLAVVAIAATVSFMQHRRKQRSA